MLQNKIQTLMKGFSKNFNDMEIIALSFAIFIVSTIPFLNHFQKKNNYHEEYFKETYCYVIDNKDFIKNSLLKSSLKLNQLQTEALKITQTPRKVEKEKIPEILKKVAMQSFYSDISNFFPNILPVHKRFSKIASTFGNRKHPILVSSRIHEGVDFDAPFGSEVYAAAAGKVEFSGKMNGYGKVIYINHAAPFQTRYAHLSKCFVKKGEIVKKGDLIGKVGNTGLSTTAHLHYEIRKNEIPQNPILYFNGHISIFFFVKMLKSEKIK